MINLILQQAFAGLWSEVWRFGLGFGIIILLLAAAYFSPILKKDFLWSALAVGVLMFGFTTGVFIGEKRVRAQWAIAEQAAIERGDQARSDAKRSAARKPSRWLRNDGDNYDRDGTQGAVQRVAPHHLFVR